VYSKGADGKTAASFQPRPKEELDKYRELVLAAIGYNEKRGDTVTLENMPFFSEPTVEETATPVAWYVRWQPYLLPAIKYTAFLVLFLLAYLLLIRPVRRRILQSLSAAASALPPGQAVSGGTKALPGTPNVQAVRAAGAEHAAGALPGAAPGSVPASFESDVEQELLRESEIAGAGFRKYDVLKKKMIEHAQKDPEQVSQLVQTWIHEKA
jgi:flagellar M-ring protein FliF